MICFYKSLKDDIKDNLYRKDIPDTLIKYIQYAVRINDRLYIHHIEKRSYRPSTLR